MFSLKSIFVVFMLTAAGFMFFQVQINRLTQQRFKLQSRMIDLINQKIDEAVKELRPDEASKQ